MEKEKEHRGQLIPDLTYEELLSHFKNKRPADLDEKTFENMSCLGMARLIVGELGGPEKARIYWMEDGNEDFDKAHAWVVKSDSDPNDKPYNNYLGTNKMPTGEATNGQLQCEGVDITEEILKEPWSRL
jgi:hypothetical protein